MGSIIGYQEAHGPVATFETDVAGMIKSLAVDINPVQSGTGDPSPDNVRPITGWTGAKVNVNGSAIDITFPSEAGTVYGGKLDLVKGELLVNMKSVVFDGTQQIDLYSSGDNRLPIYYPETVTLLDGKMVSSISRKASNYNDLMSSINTVRLVQNGIAFHLEGFKGQSWTSSAFKAYCKNLYDNDTPFQICYELATPITYQLTPQEISTIIGTNTIYADIGDTSVIYPKTITPIETVSNINLMELRRSIMMAMQHNYIPEITTYGVEWNYSDPSTVLKRTGAASRFANPIPAESLNEVGWSPFDNVYPWSEMKRYNIINGEIAYSEDDAGYSETLYDTMVYIPEFYYYAYKDTANQKWYWSISGTPLEGYEKHPGSGRYVGRFHTSTDVGGVFSKSGFAPTVNTTIANFRTYANNKGNKWWNIDLATWSAIQLLYLIEYADFDAFNIIGYMGLGNTGGTSNAYYHTIKGKKSYNSYRWIESPTSNVFTVLDGIIVVSKNVYVKTNPPYSNTTTGMIYTNIALPGNNLIKGFAYSDTCKWAFIPDVVANLSDEAYTTDYTYCSNSTGNRLTFVGGSGAWTGYGFFYFDAGGGIYYTSNQIGSRLIYIP